MLGKLMKHELKATSRILVPLYLVLFCISVINHFTFKYGAEEGVFKIIIGFLFAAQVVFIMAILIVTVFFMITRFYKNFLSDEGYLMFTLPVNTHQLILSKLIITLAWLLISFIGIVISWGIVIGPINDINLISFIMDSMQSLVVQLNTTFGVSWIALFIELIIMGVLYLIGNILLVYVSIAIGQLFKKHKIIASFASYAIIYTVLQILMVVIIAGLDYMPIENLNSLDVIPQVILPIGIVASFVLCIIFYTAIHYIFNRKLNLE